MASAPRPGRKGGKLTSDSSPILAPTAASTRSPPSVEAKLHTAETALPDAPQSYPSPFLAFDMAAVDLVGKGIVRGGAKSIRTESRTTQIKKEDVAAKFQDVFQQQLAAASSSTEVSSQREVTVDRLLSENDVLALTYHEGVNLLIRTVVANRTARALVIVPSFFVVEKTATVLRKATSQSLVATWVGASIRNLADESRIFVADAKTALQLFSKGAVDAASTFGGLTHVAFFKARAHQPVAQLVLEALRGIPHYKGKILIAGGSIADNFKHFEEYVAPRSAAASATITEAPPCSVASVSLEEACALTERDVVTVAVDRTGKFPGPHPKVAEHALEVTVDLLQQTLRLATTPQVVVIFAAEVGETMQKLEESSLKEFLVPRDELVLATEGEPVSPQQAQKDGNHRIHIFNHADMDELGELNATLVIDKGTMKCSWVPSPAEAAFPCKRTEWQSRQEQALRRRCLGWEKPGMYVALYPTESEQIFPQATSLHLELIDMEGALLQCSRVKAFVTPERLLTEFPKESILRAMTELTEVCGIVSEQDLSFTFTGEILSRLPTLTDASMLCWYGLVVGLEEAAMAAASLSTIHLFSHKNQAEQTPSDWATHVSEQRISLAGGKSKSSDVLADTVIVLKWLKVLLSEEGETAADAFAAKIDVPTYRLKSIVNLMSHLRDQLTDYAILDSFDDATGVDRILRAVELHWDVLVVLVAAAFCRKASVVRSDGEVNARDINGNMMFLRTAKTTAPNHYFPTGVTWKVGSVVIGATAMNSQQHVFLKDQTTLKTPFFLTSLVLLSPIVEYSAPQVNQDGSSSVYFSFQANSQTKRVKTSLETAARILDFRSKWNTAYGALMVLRSLPRHTTLSQFMLSLRSLDKSFSLKDIQTELRGEFISVFSSELQVVEDHRTFVNTKVHRFSPDASFTTPVTAVSKASDEALFEAFAAGDHDAAAAAQREALTATCAAENDEESETKVSSTSDATIFIEKRSSAAHHPPCIMEEDDVEDGESYFMQNGPLIEEEDE